ncbi:MAG: mechanosensitive ion channel [Cyclobacteriaceae bacterium]|nr:mechanosensitive ion channel [Cyclobacteriaceae bacterium]
MLVSEMYKKVIDFLQTGLFEMGSTQFTIGSVLYYIFLIIILFFLSGWLKNFLVNRVFKRYGLDIGVSLAVATILRYIIVVIGLAIILQSSGIDLSALGILAGALGVGIGFGLQNITNNFVSGIIILFERPVKVGDRIELNDIIGNIIDISPRATTIVTNDNIIVIVPNSEFISSRVINWSHNDRRVRFRFPVGVAYKEDPAMIKKLLLEVASSEPGVLQQPPPDVLFDEFGDSSLNFQLLVWTVDFSDRPTQLKSKLYFAIFEKFKENNIEIPFPQRDLHIKSGLKQDG